jgi:ABC-2 type transport system permease protein
VPEQYRELLALNPLTPLFIAAREAIIDPTAPGAVEAVGGWGHLIAPIAIAIAICVTAVWYFNRAAPRIAEEL